MTQQDIANKLFELKSNRENVDNTPITRATISKYENGKLGISLTTLLDLSKILKIGVDELFYSQNIYKEDIYNDNEGYSIKLLNFNKKEFENLDNETKNKMIDDAIFELSNLKYEMNHKK